MLFVKPPGKIQCGSDTTFSVAPRDRFDNPVDVAPGPIEVSVIEGDGTVCI